MGVEDQKKRLGQRWDLGWVLEIHHQDSAAVAVDPASGEVYEADSGHNRVLVYSPLGTLLARWGSGGGDGTASSAPMGTAIRPHRTSASHHPTWLPTVRCENAQAPMAMNAT